MKNVLLTLLILGAASFSYAKTSPEAYMSQMPAVPSTCCGVSEEKVSSFEKSVRDIEKRLSAEIRERKKESEAYAEANRDKVASSIIAPPEGADTSSGKKGKMTKEEKKAMREKLLREYGLSSDDTGKVKNMTKEERLAWAQSQAADADKKQQKDQKYQDAVKNAGSNSNLIQEQLSLNEKINARLKGFDEKFEALDKKADEAREKEISPIWKRLSAQFGSEGGKPKEYEKDRRDYNAACKRHCEKFSPQYRDLLNEYLSAIKACLPDYRRLETVRSKLNFGLDRPIDADDGLMGLEALDEYLDRFDNAYIYNNKEFK